MLRVRHEANHIAALVREPSDVVEGTIGVRATVTERDEALSIETLQGFGVSDEATVSILEGNDNFIAVGEVSGPIRVRVLHDEALIPANELLVGVPNEPSGEQVCFNEHLEAVADAEHGHPALRCVDDFGHDRGDGRDCSGAQVVAVTEPTGEYDRVDPLQVMVAVPQRDRFGAGKADCPFSVAVIERTGEGDDADACHYAADPFAADPSPKSMLTTSSMTLFERICAAISRTSALMSSVMGPSTVSSNRLPIRTFWNFS